MMEVKRLPAETLYAILGVVIIGGIIAGVFFLSSQNMFQSPTGAVVFACTTPYAQIDSKCCLDENNNKICDSEESRQDSRQLLSLLRGTTQNKSKSETTDSLKTEPEKETVISTIDTAPPVLTFVSPTPSNQTVLAQDWVYVNISSNEDLSSAELEWNLTNFTMLEGETAKEWYINKTGLANRNYTYYVYGDDQEGNIGKTEQRLVIIDTTSSIVVSNLSDTLNGSNWILWNWTNPTGITIGHIQIWINGTFYANVTTNYYNAPSLTSNTGYEIQTKAVDSSGNNGAWVNDTAWTKIAPVQPNTLPKIFLLAPIYNSSTIDFTPMHQFYFIDPENRTIPSCTLYYNSTLKGTKTNLTNNTWTLLEASQTQSGIYEWNIVCSDGAANNVSESRRILINVTS
ncbi:TPA: hypothetical protein H1005_02945 [archaeon]|nr:hypothetical protein [Candidatus Naiadarchaeales archaeon SRR2090153.bin1042]